MGGIDNNTLLNLHFNNFEDSSIYMSDVVNNGCDISIGGKFGKCLNVNQSYFSITKNITLNSNDCTIDFWINPSKFDGTYSYHISPEMDIMSYSNNNIEVKLFNTGLVYNTPLSLNTFSHIAIVCKNNVVKLFVNGKLVANKSISNASVTFSKGKKLFFYQNGQTAHNPVAKVDEFRISNVARWENNFPPSEVEYSIYDESKIHIVEKIATSASLKDAIPYLDELYKFEDSKKSQIVDILKSKGINISSDNKEKNIIREIERLGRVISNDVVYLVKDGITYSRFGDMLFKKITDYDAQVSVSKGVGYIKNHSTGSVRKDAVFYSSNKIDMSDYSKIKFDVKLEKPTGMHGSLGVSNNATDETFIVKNSYTETNNGYDRKIFEFDLSSVSNAFVKFLVKTNTHSDDRYDINFYVYNIWLEK